MLKYIMANRSHIFAENEHYHCFNRGVEKRVIFCDQQDYIYFLKSLRAYNTTTSLGKLRLYTNTDNNEPLVTILSYCLLPNHYHLLLRSNTDGGISKYLQKVSTGYTMYFNKKYERSGSLFQGTFKSKYISNDKDLRQVLAYVFKNNYVHGITDEALFRSSINTKDALVRGLTSNFDEKQQMEIALIIKEQRLTVE